MAGAIGLRDMTWDGGSAFLRFGSTKISVKKFTPPKLEVKVARVKRVGEMLATKRTPGSGEVSDSGVELLLTDYEELILPRLGKHAGTEIEFVLTANVYHPAVFGSFALLADYARIVSVEGPELDSSENDLVMKIGISVLDIWHKGRDGQWKTLVRKSTLPSSDAKALLEF